MGQLPYQELRSFSFHTFQSHQRAEGCRRTAKALRVRGRGPGGEDRGDRLAGLGAESDGAGAAGFEPSVAAAAAHLARGADLLKEVFRR